MKGNIASYHSKLVGVSFEGRQDIIRQLTGNEPLRFRREEENEYDPNAVAVDVQWTIPVLDKVVTEWKHIGYIARDKNAELADVLSAGRESSIQLREITGGGDKAYGINVHIEYEREKRSTRTPNAVLVTDFFGNQIFYDDVLHEYTNALGEIYTSASGFASEADFNSEVWALKAVNDYGLPEDAKDEIKEMWEVNGNASRAFGTALHAAIQLYGQYHKLADVIDMDLNTKTRKKLSAKVEKNSALSKLPYLKKVAQTFFTPERVAEVAYYEVLIVDHKNKRAGRVDRLLVLPDGSYEIRDMKTNNKMSAKDKRNYTKQLSFYADLILANAGKLGDNPIMIHHWTEDDWEDIKLSKIDTLAVETVPELVGSGSLSRQG